MREEPYHSHSHVDALTLDDDLLRYGDQWSLPLDSIRVIGELTTAAGPAADDYFIVFLDNGGKSYEVPVPALSPTTTEQLSDYFGPLKFGLHWSTDLRSRIMWPIDHADNDVYQFTRSGPKTLGDRIRRLFGTHNIDVSLSPAAEGALAEPQHSSSPARRSARVAGTYTMHATTGSTRSGAQATVLARSGQETRR